MLSLLGRLKKIETTKAVDIPQNVGNQSSTLPSVDSAKEEIKDNDEGEWLSKPLSRAPAITCYDTVVKPVDLDRLVWVRHSAFKTALPYFPARLCDNTEILGVAPVHEWPLPASHAVIEYLCTIIGSVFTEKIVVERRHVKPYYARIGSHKSCLPTINHFDCGESGSSAYGSDEEVDNSHGVGEECEDRSQWNVVSMQNMIKVLSQKYNRETTDMIYVKIKKCADEYLRASLKKEEELAAVTDEKLDESSDEVETGSALSSHQRNDAISGQQQKSIKKAGSGKEKMLRAGDWIHYQHKVFKNISNNTQIVRIDKASLFPVHLGIQVSLELSDYIVKLATDKSGQPISDPNLSQHGFLHEFTLIDGELKSSKSSLEKLTVAEESREKDPKKVGKRKHDGEEKEAVKEPAGSKGRRRKREDVHNDLELEEKSLQRRTSSKTSRLETGSTVVPETLRRRVVSDASDSDYDSADDHVADNLLGLGKVSDKESASKPANGSNISSFVAEVTTEKIKKWALECDD